MEDFKEDKEVGRLTRQEDWDHRGCTKVVRRIEKEDKEVGGLTFARRMGITEGILRRSGVLHDKSHASSRGTSEQDVDDAGHWIADEPMLAQGGHTLVAQKWAVGGLC
eukprot:1149763-Pelagomonas_calceolata.AAC.7